MYIKQPLLSHVFACSGIGYCNSLLIDLSRGLLFFQICSQWCRLPKFSDISSFMSNQVHCLPLSALIQLESRLLVVKYKLDVSPNYLRDHIPSPLSATWNRPLC